MANNLLSIKKVLVLTSASTGNNVFCTPAIRLLRKHLPHAEIEVVALNKLSAEVFAENPDINRLHVTEKSRTFNKIAQGFDWVLVLNKNALKKISGIKVPYTLVPPITPAPHHAEQLLNFVAGLLKIELVDADKTYVIKTSKEVDLLLPESSSRHQDTVINIHLGCGTTLLHGWKFFYSRRADDKKLWSIHAYIALGQALQARIPNLKIVITGTNNESFLAKKFAKQVPNTINLVGKTTVSDLAALMQRANLFIAHDCGVFHIAVASDVPIVGLFGPTNHILTGPYPNKPQHHIIKKEAMADISVNEVVVAAVKMLSTFPKNG